jgi:TonB family protein
VNWYFENDDLQKGYQFRLSLSLVLSAVLVSIAALLIPDYISSPPPSLKKVVKIDLYKINISDQFLPGEGGGGGGGSGAQALEDISMVQPNLSPVVVKEVIPAENHAGLPETDAGDTSGVGSGSGEGSGIGSGIGSGVGNGIGNGIGDGIGDGNSLAQADTIPPRPLVQVMAEYPKSESNRKVIGKVRLKVKVNAQGQVEKVTVLANSTHSSACEKEAIDAAFQSSYQPAQVNRQPVSTWTICEFGFKPD